MAFIEVLDCTREVAEFYLDSAAGDIQTAVVLWLENNPHPTTSFSSINRHASHGGGYLSHRMSSWSKRRYQEKTVSIEGLPPGFIAKVHPESGRIYFIELSTGLKQDHVPDGFADDLSVNEQAFQDMNSHSSEQESIDCVDLISNLERSKGTMSNNQDEMITESMRDESNANQTGDYWKEMIRPSTDIHYANIMREYTEPEVNSEVERQNFEEHQE